MLILRNNNSNSYCTIIIKLYTIYYNLNKGRQNDTFTPSVKYLGGGVNFPFWPSRIRLWLLLKKKFRGHIVRCHKQNRRLSTNQHVVFFHGEWFFEYTQVVSNRSTFLNKIFWFFSKIWGLFRLLRTFLLFFFFPKIWNVYNIKMSVPLNLSFAYRQSQHWFTCKRIYLN